MFAGHTALQAASQNGHSDVIKVLMKYEVNFEIEVCFFIHVIINNIGFNGSVDIKIKHSTNDLPKLKPIYYRGLFYIHGPVGLKHRKNGTVYN